MAVPTRVTHADFETLLAKPENHERRLELINGEIEERVGTYIHGLIIANIIVALKLYLTAHQAGTISTDARFSPDAANDFRPDIVVMPSGTPLVEQGAMPGVPYIAIEVQSPDQSVQYMKNRAAHYLALGVPMVWLVYPTKKLVEVLTSNTTEYFVNGEAITIEEVLPGFALWVTDIFSTS